MTDAAVPKSVCANPAKTLFCVLTFVIYTSLVFYWTYDTNLIFSSPAQEGYWISNGYGVGNDYGIIVNFIHDASPVQHGNLVAGRMISFSLVLLGFLVFGVVLCSHFKCQSNSDFLSLTVFLCLLWSHPQILKCATRATPDAFSLLLIFVVIGLASSFLMKPTYRNLLPFCIILFVLSASNPYGWSLGIAFSVSSALALLLQRRLASTIVLAAGIVSSNAIWILPQGRATQQIVFGDYFAWWVAPSPITFGSSITSFLLPTEFSWPPLVFALNLIVLSFAIFMIFRNKTPPVGRWLALAVIVFFTVQSVAELLVGKPSVHSYMICLALLPILCLVVFYSDDVRQLWVGTCVLLVLVLPGASFENSDVEIRRISEQINQSADDGKCIIFTGSLIYFTCYPMMSESARESSKICSHGLGFYRDAFVGARSIPQSSQVGSDYLSLTQLDSAIVVSSKHGQGIQVDTPSGWSGKISSYFYPDPGLEIIYLTELTRERQ